MIVAVVPVAAAASRRCALSPELFAEVTAEDGGPVLAPAAASSSTAVLNYLPLEFGPEPPPWGSILLDASCNLLLVTRPRSSSCTRALLLYHAEHVLVLVGSGCAPHVSRASRGSRLRRVAALALLVARAEGRKEPRSHAPAREHWLVPPPDIVLLTPASVTRSLISIENAPPTAVSPLLIRPRTHNLHEVVRDLRGLPVPGIRIQKGELETDLFLYGQP